MKVDDAEVMRIWRECGLPEYFLGNGGSNHKLVAFAKACGLRRPSPPQGGNKEGEASQRLSAGLAKAATALDMAAHSLHVYRAPGSAALAEQDADAARATLADLEIAASMEGRLCSDCPPAAFPDAPSRCLPCPRRRDVASRPAVALTADLGKGKMDGEAIERPNVMPIRTKPGQTPVNLPFERVPQSADDSGFGPLPATLSGWQPIETAPKDGTAILVSNEFGHRRIVAWRASGPLPCWRDNTVVGERAPISPTHWQPLPAPPEETP